MRGGRITGRVFGGGRSVGSWRGHVRGRFGDRVKTIEKILLLLPVCVSQFNIGQWMKDYSLCQHR